VFRVVLCLQAIAYSGVRSCLFAFSRGDNVQCRIDVLYCVLTVMSLFQHSSMASHGSRFFFKTAIIRVADAIKVKKTTLEVSGIGVSETAA
jgi:hypothetical protein